MIPDNRGFSTLETITALLLISVAAASVFPIVRGARRSMETIQRQGVESVRVLDLKRTLEKEMNSVRPGWWIRNPECEVGQNKIHLSGWKGYREKFWNLEVNENTVSFGSDENMRVFEMPSDTTLEIQAVDPDDFRKGIDLSLDNKSDSYCFRIYPGGLNLWTE